MPDHLRRPLDVLRDTFGYPAFRAGQEAIVRHVIDGGDALVLMPTGAGKSLCYQVPSLIREGTGIVVSPLIALMQDQVAALGAARRARGVPQLDAGAAPGGGGRTRARRGRARSPVRRARATRDDALPRAPRPIAPRAVRDRRGALRVAMGPRLPAGLSRAVAPRARAIRACRASRSPPRPIR